MKKISPDLASWLLHRNQAQAAKRQRLAGLAKSQASSGKRNRSTGWRTAVIRIPELLAAEDHEKRGALYKIVQSVVHALEHPYTVVRLDFTKTQKLYPGGTLVLLAYLELLLQEHPGRIRARCFPKSLAAQLLRHFGLADRLGINVADSQPTDDSVVNWRYLTGTGADGEKIADLLQSYKELTSVDPPEGLYDVLSEALINVRHHAYPEASNVPEAMRRWWLFARFNEPKNNRPGNLYIAIYDIGVGIQNSLRVRLQGSAELMSSMTDEILSLLPMGKSRKLERLLLKRAVEHPRSSTGLSHRGLGLPEMRDFVIQTSSGRLYIISGEAQYSCSATQNASDCMACDPAFPGTLILWSIPIQPKELAS